MLSPYKALLSPEHMGAQKVMGAPGSAFRSAKADANLWSDMRFFLNRALNKGGFYFLKNGRSGVGINIWKYIGDILMENYC